MFSKTKNMFNVLLEINIHRELAMPARLCSISVDSLSVGVKKKAAAHVSHLRSSLCSVSLCETIGSPFPPWPRKAKSPDPKIECGKWNKQREQISSQGGHLGNIASESSCTVMQFCRFIGSPGLWAMLPAEEATAETRRLQTRHCCSWVYWGGWPFSCPLESLVQLPPC